MKLIYTRILLLLVAMLSFVSADAEEKRNMEWMRLRGLDYRIKAGFNIGGSSPLPLPAEIRALNSYQPGLQIALEANAIKWFDKKWGTSLGLRFERKGMSTDARVKNYFLIMDSPDQGRLEGMWTGNVKTKVSTSAVTIPILAMYKVAPRWDLKFGPYVSFLIDKEFSGAAYDGYLREGDPTGEKVVIEGEEASYDFSTDLRNVQWGLDLGAEWHAYKHLLVYTDLTWGLNSMFPSDFKSVSFDMYNIYLTLGFGYRF